MTRWLLIKDYRSDASSQIDFIMKIIPYLLYTHIWPLDKDWEIPKNRVLSFQGKSLLCEIGIQPSQNIFYPWSPEYLQNNLFREIPDSMHSLPSVWCIFQCACAHRWRSSSRLRHPLDIEGGRSQRDRNPELKITHKVKRKSLIKSKYNKKKCKCKSRFKRLSAISYPKI